MQDEEIKALVERALRSPLEPGEWEFLFRHDYPQSFRAGEMEASDLAREVREVRREFGGGSSTGQSPARRTAPAPSPDRRAYQAAISTLFAVEAAEWPEVQAFRRDELGDELLEFDEIEGWVREHAGEASELTHWVTLPVSTSAVRSAEGAAPDDPPAQVEIPGLHQEGRLGVSWKIETLEYPVPGDRWARVIPVSAGTTLDRLRRLSERLARAFSWSRAQATVFVLTGQTPLVRTLSVSFRGSTSAPATTRITMQIDPATPASEVAQAYRRIKQRLTPSKTKTVSEKHATLAAFVATCDEERWAERMRAWNERYPDWRYEYESNFRRDAHQAQQRLLRPPYRLMQAFAEGLSDGEEEGE